MDITENLISIIVPVYNVELYIEDCLKSLINQTYKNIEIIIVIDGSTDESEKICEKYRLLDNRILIIRQVNKGLSEARNTGIKHARGKYVIFVDSDDWLEKSAVFDLLEATLKEKAEVVIGQCLITDKHLQNNPIQRNYCSEEDEQKLNSSSSLKKLFCGRIPAYAWGKLYDISLFKKHGIEFTPHIHYEDIDIMYRLLDKADRIIVINKPIYNYRVREGSITAVFRISDVEDLLQIKKRLTVYFRETPYFKKKEFSYYQLSLLFLEYSILYRTKKKKKRKELFRYIKDEKKQWKLSLKWYWRHRELPMIYKIIAMKIGVAGILIKIISTIK